MSLRVERDERTITVISDDRNAENALLGEAIEVAAPHLATAYNETPTADDGELRFSVEPDDWQSLLEVLEAMEAEYPEAAGTAIEQVESWVRELDVAQG